MVSAETRTSAVLEAPPALADCAAQAPRIIEEFNDIIAKSRRPSRLRRALRRVGGAIGKSLDRLVPPTADATDDSDLPPQIRFPFY